MGCDIHFFTEKRNADGIWEFLPAPKGTEGDRWAFYVTRNGGWDLGRNYEFFDALAGVRCQLQGWSFENGKFRSWIDEDPNHVHDLTTPLFVPGDPEHPDDHWHTVSPEVQEQIESWSTDGHSHHVGTVRELMHEQIMKTYSGPDFQGESCWQRCLRWLTEQAEGDLDSVRAVFWFDN